jgi:hypothetical protein
VNAGKSGATHAEISRPAGAVIKLADQGANGVFEESYRADSQKNKQKAFADAAFCVILISNISPRGTNYYEQSTCYAKSCKVFVRTVFCIIFTCSKQNKMARQHA